MVRRFLLSVSSVLIHLYSTTVATQSAALRSKRGRLLTFKEPPANFLKNLEVFLIVFWNADCAIRVYQLHYQRAVACDEPWEPQYS